MILCGEAHVGRRLRDGSLRDVAPTLLHLLGLPKAAGDDGRAFDRGLAIQSGPTHSRLASMAPHVLAACWFAALACLLTYPLVRELSTSIPGTGPGDNVAFLWDLWWFRTVRHSADLHYLQCPYLFAPFGTSLVLHTAAPLQSFIGATLLARLPIVTAHNLLILAALTANGLATYALTVSQTKRPDAAVLAGTILASSTYIGIHLLGHINLVNAWVLPLGALAWIAFLAAASVSRSVLVAAAFAAAAYPITTT